MAKVKTAGRKKSNANHWKAANGRAPKDAPSKNGPRKKPKPPFPEQRISLPGEEHKMRPRPQYEAPEYRGSDKLKGLAALITGGDSGIGRAVAVLFAREGADVAIIHLPEEQTDADETLAAIEREGAKGISLPGDVRDPKFCRRAVEKTVKKFGRLDILVNNAAYQQHRKGIDEIDLEQWDRTFQTNIYGYFYMVKAALPHLERGSAIINTGSITPRRKGRFTLLPNRWPRIWPSGGFA
jgi:hypothetical protein